MKLITLLSFLIITSTIGFGQKGNRPKPTNSKPFIIGTIEELQSKVLGEKRILNVYIPNGYNGNDTTKYSVIYLLDGSADEDFLHVSGIVQFYSFPWINLLPKSIVVGIANVDRRRDFTYPTTVLKDKEQYPTTGNSNRFIRFIETELEPFIDKKYHTSTSKTIIGQSLGGLLATEILFKKPDLFSTYIIISPSLWWDNGSLLNSSEGPLKADQESKHIYIGVGKEGLTRSEIPSVIEGDANLLAEKVRKIKNPLVTVIFDYLPKENHATIEHQAILNAFNLIYHL